MCEGEGLESRPQVEELIHETGALGSRGRWVSACDLRVGDRLHTLAERETLIRGIESVEVRMTTFNFHVENYHDYTVSRFGVLVHNVSCPKLRSCMTAREKTYIKRCNKARRDAILAKCPTVQDRLMKNCKSLVVHYIRKGKSPSKVLIAKCPKDDLWTTELTALRKETIRGKSPSKPVKELARAKPDKWKAVEDKRDKGLKDKHIVVATQVDHIMALNTILSTFAVELECLSGEEQLAVANLLANLQVISQRVNASRQNKAWKDWKGYKIGKDNENLANPAFHKAMIVREEKANKAVESYIDGLISGRFD